MAAELLDRIYQVYSVALSLLTWEMVHNGVPYQKAPLALSDARHAYSLLPNNKRLVSLDFASQTREFVINPTIFIIGNL